MPLYHWAQWMKTKKKSKTSSPPSRAMLSFILNFLLMLCKFVLWSACKKSRSSKATDLMRFYSKCKRSYVSIHLSSCLWSVLLFIFIFFPSFHASLFFRFELRTHWIRKEIHCWASNVNTFNNSNNRAGCSGIYECNDGIRTLLFTVY